MNLWRTTLILFWLGHFTRFEIIGIYTKHIKRAIPVISQQTFILMKMSWRCLSSSSSEDVFRRRLQKTSSRRLDQDEYVRLSLTSSEDVFKTSSRRLGQDQYIRLGHMSSRRLQDIFKTFLKLLQGVFKTSSRRLAKIFSRRFQGVPSG